MTIREQIKEIQTEVAKGDLLPGRAAELLTTLSALFGNTLEEITDADVCYNAVLLGFLEKEAKANRAKIKAECSPEYLRKQQARNAKDLIVEMMRSLKFYLKAKEQEYNQSKYQV